MSSPMSGRLDLTPADLDRLEDALEDLEFSSLDDLADDDPVAQRLSEYRELLALGRQALPLEDVPAGLLDGVLAEARQVAATKPAPVDAADRPSFWARWRLGTWVPALAFAGSAALLLVVLVPERSSEPDVAKVAQADHAAKYEDAKADAKAAAGAPADGRIAYAEAEREQAEGLLEGEAQRSAGVAIGERAPEPAAAPAEELADDDQAAEPELATKTPTRRNVDDGRSPGAAAGGKPMPKAPAPTSSGSSKGKTNSLPDPLGADTGVKKDAPKESPKAEQKPNGSWSEIERADADRRGGSCGLAKMRYDKLRKSDDARVRARALAGAGLCAAASDDMSTAKKLFAQARAADPGVSSFIDRELAAIEGEPTNADEPPRAAE